MANEIIIDKTDLVELKLALSTIKGGAASAIRMATNDSMAGVRTESVKLIGGKVTAKAAVIRKHFSIKKMSVNDLSANITCAGTPVPLISYSARSVKKGVSVKVLKSGKRDIVRHAFIAKMRSGHEGVFWREENIRGKKWRVGVKIKLPAPSKATGLRKYQLPIRELYGPRIPDVFDDADIMTPILANASKRFDDRLKHHTDRLMAKAKNG